MKKGLVGWRWRSAVATVLSLGWGVAGCGDSPCEELRAVCERCPTDGSSIALAASDSCYRTVESNDEQACSDRIELGTYTALGCAGP